MKNGSNCDCCSDYTQDFFAYFFDLFPTSQALENLKKTGYEEVGAVAGAYFGSGFEHLFVPQLWTLNIYSSSETFIIIPGWKSMYFLHD